MGAQGFLREVGDIATAPRAPPPRRAPGGHLPPNDRMRAIGRTSAVTARRPAVAPGRWVKSQHVV